MIPCLKTKKWNQVLGVSSYSWKMVLKWPSVCDTGEETLHVYCVGIPGHRALQVIRVILRRHLEIAGYPVVTLGKDALHIHYSCLPRHGAF